MAENTNTKYAYCEYEKQGNAYVIRCPDGTLFATRDRVRLGEDIDAEEISPEDIPSITKEILGFPLYSPRDVYMFAKQIHEYLETGMQPEE
jgi:hypothetical protein